MLMSVKNENAAGGESVVLERPQAGGVYASLFEKINLNPVASLSALDSWQDNQTMSDATADERVTAAMQIFLERLKQSGGTGQTFPWHLLRDFAARYPVACAGGLNPDNVSAAILALQPAIVDCSSGIERNLEKQADLMAAFCHAVRD